ncbi:major capsid protein [Dechloromonas sp. XY25]|uniref:Major capsid protein n=1 Tax=Dechloromonas hankyongensis TaxID=2908002 RepID=A0ABS9K351_9RHOO|nr:major capsid protein [Dechloromonas hankyongensis]MCG2577592.1 major capsid protein [Dechloromonas hankyongensis]
MRKMYETLLKKKKQAKAAAVAGLSAIGAQAHAALSTTEVQTALTGAQTTGESVGGMVIAVVAGLVVVGVIIALVKKV